MKLLNEAWLRVELVTRKNRADVLSGDMVDGVLWLVGHQAIVNTISFPDCKWWNEIFYETEATLSTVPKKVSKYQKWISTQVTASIKKNLDDPEYTEFLEGWIDHLFQYKSKRTKRSDNS